MTTTKLMRCGECVYCIRRDISNQIGLCTEMHSPRTAQGKPQKNVHLWSYSCPYCVSEHSSLGRLIARKREVPSK